MNKLFKDILPAVADKIQAWWTFWIIGIAVAMLIGISVLESVGLIKNKDQNEDDPGY